MSSAGEFGAGAFFDGGASSTEDLGAVFAFGDLDEGPDWG